MIVKMQPSWLHHGSTYYIQSVRVLTSDPHVSGSGFAGTIMHYS